MVTLPGSWVRVGLRSVLGARSCTVHAVRLLRPGPGATVREHHDPGLDLDRPHRLVDDWLADLIAC